ncbi:MAG: hypothetical protein H6713_00600 [Myxococcales bacterium]|nr:hypothetical protein [Myxococcales bacterium]
MLQLLATLALVNLQIILGNLALARLDTMVALVVFFALGLALLLAAWMLQRLSARSVPELSARLPSLALAGIFWGMVTGFLIGFFCVPEYLNLQTGGSTRDVPVAEAPRYDGLGHRHYAGGALRPELEAEFEIHYRNSDGEDRPNFYRVVPIVGPDWQPSQPVPLWAGTTSERFSFNGWVEERRAIEGVLLHKGVYYRKAIARAGERHGLTEALGAPILRLDARPYEELIARARNRTLLLLLGASALWALFFLRVRGLRDPDAR